MLQSVYCMWLFLINPLKLCSYGSWSLQGYVCKSSCCQYHIYIYNLARILKCLKTLSISLIDDSAAATQPLSHSSHSARVADAATQPLSHSEWLSGWVAARVAERLSGWVAEWLGWKFPPLLFNVLGTLPGQLFLDTSLDTCLSEPCLGTCSWEPCLGTCSWGPILRNLLLGALSGNLFLGTLSWEPVLGNFACLLQTCSLGPCSGTRFS